MLIQKLKRHPFIHLLITLEGNPRACVFTEPLWGVPYYLYTPFATLFMYALGLDDIKIGTVISATLLGQFVSSIIAGPITDKFGRRITVFAADIVGWVAPALLWAGAQGYVWFIVAGVLSSASQISGSAFNCLIVEDAKPNKLVGIFTWIYLAGLFSVFFAPLSIILIQKFALVAAVRIMYLFLFCMMVTKMILLLKFSKETRNGIIKIAENRGKSLFTGLKGSYGILRHMIKTPRIYITVVFLSLLNTTSVVTSNFYSLIIAKNLNISETYLAVFPVIRAFIMIIFIFGMQRFFDRYKMRFSLLSGIIIYILSQLMLAFAFLGGLAMVVAYIALEAFAYAIVMPRRDSLLGLNATPEERARIYGLVNAFIIAIGVPFGYLSGFLSSVNRTLPFFMNIVLYAAAFSIAYVSKNLFTAESEP